MTMYENVWVEPVQGPPLPPRLKTSQSEASIVSRDTVSTNQSTKTGRLEEIFNNRKQSQESLVSHASGGSASGTLQSYH